ncbi:Anoctamin-4 [Lamellibrachia satsuma]|nr:Anoctamin-4 [Lamellibrachia satsuma]
MDGQGGPAPIGFEMQDKEAAAAVGINGGAKNPDEDMGPPPPAEGTGAIGFEGLVSLPPNIFKVSAVSRAPGAGGEYYPYLPDPMNGRTMNHNLGMPVSDAMGPPPVEGPVLGFEGLASSRPQQAIPGLYPHLPDPMVGKWPNNNSGSMDDMTEIKVVPNEEADVKTETLFFDDGRRRIDFVLVYKDTKDGNKAQHRRHFEDNLINEGIEIEVEDKEKSPDKKTYYSKLHAPWAVLAKMAEYMRIKVPIQEYDEEEKESRCFSKIPCNPFTSNLNDIPEEPCFFTADYNREREDSFLIHDKDTLFTSAQRSYMVYELLLRTRYSDDNKEKLGIDRMIKNGIYTAAYPLHESEYECHHSKLTHQKEMTDRQWLYETWAKPGRWHCYQPLDLIRKYFGEKIGMYFAWLGFYTIMLIPPSIVGLVVFFYGVATLYDYKPSEEICDENRAGNFTMCPLCDTGCGLWPLRISCTYARLTYLFDNEATVFFAGFMAIWASVFLEFWKRQEAELQYDWDVAAFKQEERLRPEYEAKVKRKKMNPVTKLLEPYLPNWSKYSRKLTSTVVILFMICLVLGAVMGVIIYRMIIVGLLYAADNEVIQQNAKLTTTATAALINLIVIIFLNKVYQEIAIFLTNLERPRTDTEYNDSFTFKMFLFQFINFYSAIFYVAFFKGRLGGRPGQYDYTLGYRAEECDPAGCLIELCIQLGVVMVGKQTFNNFKELFLPKIMNWFRQRKSVKKVQGEGSVYTLWEQDLDLTEQPPLGLFDEYLEMVVQYGFVTIFVAAFPLAPFFALLNNIIEIRLDAYKFVTVWKRPVALRAESIGIWFGILQSVSFIAVLTNAFIIGWTSDFVPKLVYKLAISQDKTLGGYINHSLSFFDVKDFQNQTRVTIDNNVKYCRYSDYRYPPEHDMKYEFTTDYWHILVARLAFVIVFEHCVFFLTWLVTILIPDVSSEVRVLMLRELYLAKEARYGIAKKED